MADAPPPDHQSHGETTEPDPPSALDIVEVARTETKRTFTPGFGRVALFLAIGVVVVLQVMILQRLQSTDEDLAATRAAVTGLQVDVSSIDNRIDALDEDVAGLSDLATRTSPSETPAGQVSVAAGSLPPFTDPQNDAAVLGEYVLGELTATEYYTDEPATIAPADGTARVWLVWAHWCPYCQQELPDLAQWWPENADRFPNTELVTVSTSMDETRGNPLTPYLNESQFPFPVLMDPDLQLATQFGTSAFPFWVVTDGDGKVVFRVAGAVGLDTIEAIFTQVQALVTGT